MDSPSIDGTKESGKVGRFTMIKIAGTSVSPSSINGQWPSGSSGRNIIDIMAISEVVYDYDSLDLLQFELKLRTNIIAASKDLAQSGVEFAGFSDSRCNSDYWYFKANEFGLKGFQLKHGVKPSTAITDIITKGSKYAFECATAMVIVYYRAVLETLPEETFNKLFAGIYLNGWNRDEDLGFTSDKRVDYFPGDYRYFKNPDVNPRTPEWQGENVIDLGDGTYYGHGIGIQTADQMIASLNAYRKPGATRSAYLMDMAGYPDFKYLAMHELYAAEREVQDYQVGWRHDTKHGVVVLHFNDGGDLQIDPLTYADYMSFVDTLRNEKPVYYNQLQNVVTTLKEPVGEEET